MVASCNMRIITGAIPNRPPRLFTTPIPPEYRTLWFSTDEHIINDYKKSNNQPIPYLKLPNS